MKKNILNILLFLFIHLIYGQTDYSYIFRKAYDIYPQIPIGCLEAVAFNNTRFTHITEKNYLTSDLNDMPHSYGVMGLVLDGKGYFRNNLLTVSELSNISVNDILNYPDSNIIAYASAFAYLCEKQSIHSMNVVDYKNIFIELSELPLPTNKVDDDFVLNTMLYSIYNFLNNNDLCKSYNIPERNIDLKDIFKNHYDKLSSSKIIIDNKSINGADYDKAIWQPAPDCNYSHRGGSSINGVVIHYTAGTYAGAISWFLNCDSHVSSHYIIRSIDGQITQMVREKDMAYHVRSANCYTIGIEHEAYGDIISYFTKEMYSSSANLVKDICRRNTMILPYRMFYSDTLDNGEALDSGVHSLGDSTSCVKIRGHQHYPSQTHTDPGPYWNWNYYYKLVNDDINPLVFDSVSGFLYDSGGKDGNYDNDERKCYLIHVPDADSIALIFLQFNLEKDKDFMWIYDGESVFSPLIGRWNTKSPGVVFSSGNSIFIEFRSNCDITSDGWVMQWKAFLHDSIGNNVEDIVAIYPNPVEDKMNIILKKNSLPIQLFVYDMYGHCCKKYMFLTPHNKLNVSDLKRGIYFFRFTHGKGNIKIFKVVKL